MLRVPPVLRSPLALMIGAEVVVVGALGFTAWDVLASSKPSSPPPPIVTAPAPPAGPSALPVLPAPATSLSPQLLPGLNVDSGFWRLRLAQLNRDQVWLERLEWQLVSAAEGAVERYLESVVLPSITRAERAGGATAMWL